MESTILTTFQNLLNDILMLNNITNDEEILNYYDNILNMETLDLDNCDIINKFLKSINDNSELIIEENDIIFDKELLPFINFKEILSIEENSVIKKNIWKYFQTFNIISININSSEELKLLLSGNNNKSKHRKKDINDLKKIKQLKENIIKNETEISDMSDADETNNEPLNFESMQNMFKGTDIGNLAEDIASNINFDNIVKDIDTDNPDPSKLLETIMKPETFNGLFSSINSMVQNKINNNEINTDHIQNEANNLFSNFKDNPIMKDMVNNANLKEDFQQENSNPTRDRLRKKLNKRENGDN